ncbi:MAG: hypothetical protein AABZ31_11570 [Bdellovibrionota bacterium]
MEYVLLWSFLKLIDSSFEDVDIIERAPASLEQPTLLMPPKTRHSQTISLASGAGYTRISQNVSSDQKMQSSGVVSPAYRVQATWSLSKKWSLEASYQNTPGELNSSIATFANEREVTWDSFRMNILKFINSRTALTVGAEQQSSPFIYQEADDSLHVSQSKISNAILGLRHQRVFKKTALAFSFNLLSPFHSENPKGDLSLQSELAYEASVEFKYHWAANFNLGFGWRALQQENHFKFRSSSSNFNGEQKYFNSVIDLGLGWEM